jgi:hypothetical protein
VGAGETEMLLDAEVTGCVFLKGLYLSRTATSNAFQYCYDIDKGYFNYSYYTISKVKEEAKAVAAI